MSSAEARGAIARPAEERLAAMRASAKGIKEKRGRKPEFPPGALETFRPLWAEVCSEAQIGIVDNDAVMEQSLKVPEGMTPRKAAQLCIRQGISAIELVNALVEPSLLQPQAFGELSEEAILGLKALLWAEITPFFAPANKKKRPVLK